MQDYPPKSSTRLRVAIFADMPRNALGGAAKGRGGGHAATWLPQIADIFSREADLDIWWISFDPKTTRPELINEANQHFIRLPKLNLSISLLLEHRYVRRIFRKLLDRLGPDVVHTWGTERAYPTAMEACDAPSILSMQGILTEYARIGSLPQFWQWKRMAQLESRWLKAATVVTSESQWGIDRVHEIVPDKESRMIEYGVHPSFYDLKWQPNTEKPYVFFCGSVDWRKGVDVLADAAAKLKGRNWEIRLAGDGPLRREIEKREIPGFNFLGNLPWEAMREHLRQATCMVLPTRADTSPNAAKEARVVGLPLITTRHGGQSGYIIHEQNGLIVDPLDADTLAAALSQVMETPGLAAKMGATRHQEDREYLRAERTAQGFTSLYRELANR